MKKLFIHEYWTKFNKPEWYDIRLNTGKQFYKIHDRYKIIVSGGEYGIAELIQKQDMILMRVPENVCHEGFDDYTLNMVHDMLERIYIGKKEWDGMKTCVSVLVFRWVEKYKGPVFLEEKK